MTERVALNSGKLVLGWQDSKSRAMLLRRGFFMNGRCRYSGPAMVGAAVDVYRIF
jgi:hypothetical protein